MSTRQYVCLVCGYNMVGYHPDRCPFCGAQPEHFITSEECSRRHTVQERPISPKIAQLRSVPDLGLEHAAYRVQTGGGTWWIDCPSCFDPSQPAPSRITFTHHHFLGASNLYRERFSCPVRIHDLDSRHELCRGFPLDEPFAEDFHEDGVETIHLDGHTPGFTFYAFEDVLFVCDYVFWEDGALRFNPYGPTQATRRGGQELRERLSNRPFATVCGYRDVLAYGPWREAFDRLLERDSSP